MKKGSDNREDYRYGETNQTSTQRTYLKARLEHVYVLRFALDERVNAMSSSLQDPLGSILRLVVFVQIRAFRNRTLHLLFDDSGLQCNDNAK